MKDLFECYKKPSTAKQAIYNDCVQQAINDNAYDYGIRSYNVFMFTFGYKYINSAGQHTTG